MIKNVNLSAFADEYSSDIERQLSMLEKHGVRYFEPRFIGTKNVSELDKAEAKELARKLAHYGIGVSAIGSPLGKIRLSDDFNQHTERAKRIFETANILGASRVRVFSFYMRDGQTRSDARGEVLERLDEMITLAEAYGITLCHENESGIYGESPEHCADILSYFGGRLRAVFDMGNFVLGGYSPYPDAYGKLLPYIEYFHIKDAIGQGAIVPPGLGEARISDILTAFSEHSATPFFVTLEPHLETFSGLNRLTESKFNNPYKFESPETAFLEALSRIKKMIGES